MITPDNSAKKEELYKYLHDIGCGHRGWKIKTNMPYEKGSFLLDRNRNIILRADSNKQLLGKLRLFRDTLRDDPERFIRNQAGGLGIVQPKYEGQI